MMIETVGLSSEYSDKIDHAIGGAVIGGASSVALRLLWPDQKPAVRFVEALIPVVIAGIGKEVYDHQHPATHDCDWRDAASTIGGGALAIAITFRF